jgi:hypothetical protein
VQAAVEAAPILAKEISQVPSAIANSALRAIRGGDLPVKDKSWLDKTITSTKPSQDANEDQNYSGLQGIGSSLGYSLTTMVSSALAATAATFAAGPVAGVVAGMGTSGTVAYRASVDEFLSQVRDKLDANSKQIYGRGLNESEWDKASKEFLGAAREYGAWEAIPETVSNLIFIKAFTTPLKAVNSVERLARITKRAGLVVGSEMGTETITAKGQNAAELKAGLTNEELSLVDAFRQQFLQTLITTGAMAGGAKSIGAAKNFYQKQVEPRVSPGSALARAIQADLDLYSTAQSRSEAIRRMSPDYQDAAMVSPRETSARAAAADQLLQNYEQETRTGSPEQRNALIAAYQTDLGLPLDVATAMVDQQLAATQPPPPAAPPPAPPPAGAGPNQVTDIPAGVDPQRVADIELELINYGVEPAAARIGAINRAAQEAKDDAEANAAATQQEAPSATVSTDGTAPSGGGVAATLQQQPGASTEGITDAQSGGVDGAQPVVTQSATGEGAQPGALNNYVYKGPKDIPQNIWDLHQAARLAVDVANGHKYHPSQIGGGRPISSGQLKRNQTMSFRRLNNAVKAYLPNDQEAQLKLMRDLNVESRRREEEAGTDAQSGGVDGAQPVVTQSATGEGAQPGALVPRQAAVSFDGRKGIVGNEAVLGGLRRVVADDDVALDNPSRVGAVMLTGIDRQAGGSAGRASEVLTALTNWADISNERIILSPAASGDLKQPELVKWYERNGFTTTPDGLMERNPSTTEQTTGTITPAAKPTTPSDPITLINQYASQTGAERRATYAQLRNKSPEELQSAIQTLQAERQKLLSKDGKRPAKNSEKAKLWVDLTDKGDLLTTIWGDVTQTAPTETVTSAAPTTTPAKPITPTSFAVKEIPAAESPTGKRAWNVTGPDGEILGTFDKKGDATAQATQARAAARTAAGQQPAGRKATLTPEQKTAAAGQRAATQKASIEATRTAKQLLTNIGIEYTPNPESTQEEAGVEKLAYDEQRVAIVALALDIANDPAHRLNTAGQTAKQVLAHPSITQRERALAANELREARGEKPIIMDEAALAKLYPSRQATTTAAGGETVRATPGGDLKRLAKMLGSKLYGKPDNIASVSIKELFQNAFDAIKESLEKYGLKQGRITVNIDTPNRTVTIIDNGAGMPASVMGKQFLEIAGTVKNTDRPSGGLGVAKMLFLFENKKLEAVSLRDGVVSRLVTTGDDLKAAMAANPATMLEQLKDFLTPEDIDIIRPVIEASIKRLKASGVAVPEIVIDKSTDLQTVEQYTKTLFPEGHGTAIIVQIPESYVDSSTGAVVNIPFEQYRLQELPVLKHSPLFNDIEVKVVSDGMETIQPIGSNFPINDFTSFANVRFDWGVARIYVSKNIGKFTLYDNAHVLSNGLWQFDTTYYDAPGNNGSPIKRQFYIDVSPKATVKPDDPGYPFDLNRQRFSPSIQPDFDAIAAYIAIVYHQMDLAGEVKNFGTVQYINADGTLTTAKELKPTVPPRDTAFSVIKPGDTVEVKDGVLYVNNRPIPELTPEQLKTVTIRADELIIPQDEIDANKVMVHDNTSFGAADDIKFNGPDKEQQSLQILQKLVAKHPNKYTLTVEELQEIGTDGKPLQSLQFSAPPRIIKQDSQRTEEGSASEILDALQTYSWISLGSGFRNVKKDLQEFKPPTQSLSEVARAKFGADYDKYLAYIGNIFYSLRSALIAADPAKYAGLKTEAVGISIDNEYYGVSTRIPFSGMFINPATTKLHANSAQIALSMIGTMEHELGHFRVRNHNADFVSEMQDVIVLLETSTNFNVAEAKQNLTRFIEDNKNIFDFLKKEFDSGYYKNRGSKFKDASNQQIGDGSTAEPVVGTDTPAKREKNGLLERTGKRATPTGQELQPSTISTEVTGEKPLASGIPLGVTNENSNAKYTTFKNAGQALSWISRNGTKFEKFLAKRLYYFARKAQIVIASDMNALPEAVRKEFEKNAAGVYFKNVIYLHPVYGINNTVFLHEALHGATIAKITEYLTRVKNGESIPPAMQAAYLALETVRMRASDRYFLLKDAGMLDDRMLVFEKGDAFSDLKEFIAYGLSNEVMHEFLLQAPGLFAGKATNYFNNLLSNFVKGIRGIFGMDATHQSALQDLILATDNLLSTRMRVRKTATAPPSAALPPSTPAQKLKQKVAKVSKAMAQVQASSNAQDVVDGISTGMAGRMAEDWLPLLKDNYAAFNVGTTQQVLYKLPTSDIIRWKGDEVPGLKRVDTLVQRMAAMRGTMQLAGAKKATELAKFVRKNGQKVIGEAMHLARLNEVSPTKYANRADALANDPDIKENTAKSVDPKYSATEQRTYKGEVTKRTRAINEVFTAWEALGKQSGGHSMYKMVRKFYIDSYNLIRTLLNSQIQALPIDAAAKAKLMKSVRLMQEQGEAIVDTAGKKQNALPEEYTPFMRYGENWLRVTAKGGGPAGRAFYTFESGADRNKFQRQEAARLGKDPEDASVFSRGSDLTSLRKDFANESVMLKEMFSAIDKATTSSTISSAADVAVFKDGLKDQLYQVYLLTLPERNLRKQFLNAKNITGFSADIFRNFKTSATKLANQASKLRYATEIQNEVIAARESLAGRPPSEVEKLSLFVNEIAWRANEELNPTPRGRVAAAASQFAFVMLLTSAASAMIQFASIPIMVMNRLNRDYGYGKSAAKFARYMPIWNTLGVTTTEPNGDVTYSAPSIGTSKMVTSNPVLQRAFEEAVNRQVTSVGNVSIITNNKKTPENTRRYAATAVLESAYGLMTGLFSGAERLSREMTYMMAFELEYAKTKDFDASVEKAIEVTQDTLFRYDTMERPRILRTGLGSVVGQFKMYAAGMTSFLIRNMYNSMRVTNPKEALPAVHLLSGVLLTGAMFHGLAGSPFYSTITTLIDLILNSGDEDEEKKKRRQKNPLTAQSSDLRFRYEFLPEQFGEIMLPGIDGKEYKLSTVLEKGPISVLTDVNVGSRTSFNNMLFRSAPEGKDWWETALNIAEANLGPSVSAGDSFISGVEDLTNGKIRRGLEKINPGITKGSIVASRYADEGAQTRDRKVILERNEISGLNLAAQVLGFTPTRLARIQEHNYSNQQVVDTAKKEKNKLLKDLKDLENNPDRDPEARKKLDRRIDQHNRRYNFTEELTIDEDTRERSLEAYEEREQKTIRGLYSSDELRFYLDKTDPYLRQKR